MKNIFRIDDEKITDRALTQSLLVSGFSILLCIIALCSMSYAWFSTGFSNGGNVIQSAAFDLDITVTPAGGSATELTKTNGFYTYTITAVSSTLENGGDGSEPSDESSDESIASAENIESAEGIEGSENTESTQNTEPVLLANSEPATYTYTVELKIKNGTTASKGYCMVSWGDADSDKKFTSAIYNDQTHSKLTFTIQTTGTSDIVIKFVPGWGTAANPEIQEGTVLTIP